MRAFISMLTGAGLMYLLDPDRGRRRRALLRDKFIGLQNDLEDAANVISKDMSNRMQGLRSGDLSVLVGGKNALPNPLRGGWSPTGRTILAGMGAGLFLYGLSRRAPTACALGTAGLAMIAEGFTNAGLDDIRHLPQTIREKIKGGSQESNEAQTCGNVQSYATQAEELREFSL